jgi:5'-3' exonuclease
MASSHIPLNNLILSPLYLIDASIYIFRSYFSLPENWHSKREGKAGYPTQAVYGYLNFLLKLLEQESPNYMAAAFDESLGSCFRNDIYPDYKANRVLPDEALEFQLNACVEVTKLLGITGLASNTHEADDIVGTLAKAGRNQGHNIVVVSGDKDLSQLVIAEQDVIWDFGKKDPLNREAVKEKMGVWPEQVADYLALVGDSIDCIPGVPGVGDKTATALLNHFESIDDLLAVDNQKITDIPVRGAKKLPDKIAEYREQILMARELTVIAEDAPIGQPQLQRQTIALDKLTEFCDQMGLGGRLIARAEKVNQQMEICTE